MSPVSRREELPPRGVYYAGAVMQHMVGAKLDCALGQGKFEHDSYSTSDQQSGRSGDFLLAAEALQIDLRRVLKPVRTSSE
jgi:hypothetical protein